MAWLEKVLKQAAAKPGMAVHILGHQPPQDAASPGSNMWREGYYEKFSALLSQSKHVVRGIFFGHIHTDQWVTVNACRNTTGAPYQETTGIKWCSGGGDWACGDIFGDGVDGYCPIIPTTWTTEEAVAKCEQACSGNQSCVGFTMYFQDLHKKSSPAECCFRTGSTASKPSDPTSSARCYEKPGGVVCDGDAVAVVIPGPSLTEGWPATNPTVRLLEFDPITYELLDMTTYFGDLHQANRAGSFTWSKEYSFRDFFGMEDLSPASFRGLNNRLADVSNSTLWNEYRGQGDGSLYCSRYDSTDAKFKPINPCAECSGECRVKFTAVLNGSSGIV